MLLARCFVIKVQNGTTSSCPSRAMTGPSECAAMAINSSARAQMVSNIPGVKWRDSHCRRENDFGFERAIVDDMRNPWSRPSR